MPALLLRAATRCLPAMMGTLTHFHMAGPIMLIIRRDRDMAERLREHAILPLGWYTAPVPADLLHSPVQCPQERGGAEDIWATD